MNKITKDLEGLTVWLRPNGNTARNKSRVVAAKVEKVGRVFITLVQEGYKLEEKFRFTEKDNHLDNGHNGGYYLFKSKEALEEDSQAEKLRSEIRKKIQEWESLRGFELSALRAIADLLGVSE